MKHRIPAILIITYNADTTNSVNAKSRCKGVSFTTFESYNDKLLSFHEADYCREGDGNVAPSLRILDSAYFD